EGGASGRSVGAVASLVDFNRGGTPLVEIVSSPDLRSGDEALRFLRLLRQTIVELGVSDAEMEKGTLRADVNVSVRERGEEGYRPRWEIKNMNSFTFIGRAIEAAIRQQTAAHEAGETVEQSTYDYDPDTDRLTVHRSKEEADDYRYFPEPDLVPLEPPAELVERLRAEPGFSAEQWLAQRVTSDESALEPAIDAVLAANPEQVATYRGGKEGVLGFLVGQVMRETQGKADPKVVNRLLREKLKA